MGAAYSSLGRTKVLYATSLVLRGAKAKFLQRKPNVLVALEEISEMCYGYAKVFCRLNVFQSLVVKGVIKENLFVFISCN